MYTTILLENIFCGSEHSADCMCIFVDEVLTLDPPPVSDLYSFFSAPLTIERDSDQQTSNR